MAEETLVSIVTVCYNSERTIRRTIESVLNQTYSRIEYIIVDGASSDHTMDIVREYEPRFSGRMIILSEKDNGIYDAMNKGINLAKGELVGIINSDDYYENDAVESIVQAWDGTGMQILHGLMRNIRQGRAHSVIMNYPEFLDEKMIQHPSCFVTKDVYDTIGCYNSDYISVSDYDFMLRAHESGKVRFIPVYHIVANFCDGGVSESSKAIMEKIKFLRKRGKISGAKYFVMTFAYPLKSKIYKWIWEK